MFNWPCLTFLHANAQHWLRYLLLRFQMNLEKPQTALRFHFSELVQRFIKIDFVSRSPFEFGSSQAFLIFYCRLREFSLPLVYSLNLFMPMSSYILMWLEFIPMWHCFVTMSIVKSAIQTNWIMLNWNSAYAIKNALLYGTLWYHIINVISKSNFVSLHPSWTTMPLFSDVWSNPSVQWWMCLRSKWRGWLHRDCQINPASEVLRGTNYNGHANMFVQIHMYSYKSSCKY